MKPVVAVATRNRSLTAIVNRAIAISPAANPAQQNSTSSTSVAPRKSPSFATHDRLSVLTSVLDLRLLPAAQAEQFILEADFNDLDINGCSRAIHIFSRLSRRLPSRDAISRRFNEVLAQKTLASFGGGSSRAGGVAGAGKKTGEELKEKEVAVLIDAFQCAAFLPRKDIVLLEMLGSKIWAQKEKIQLEQIPFVLKGCLIIEESAASTARMNSITTSDSAAQQTPQKEEEEGQTSWGSEEEKGEAKNVGSTAEKLCELCVDRILADPSAISTVGLIQSLQLLGKLRYKKRDLSGVIQHACEVAATQTPVFMVTALNAVCRMFPFQPNISKDAVKSLSLTLSKNLIGLSEDEISLVFDSISRAGMIHEELLNILDTYLRFIVPNASRNTIFFVTRASSRLRVAFSEKTCNMLLERVERLIKQSDYVERTDETERIGSDDDAEDPWSMKFKPDEPSLPAVSAISKGLSEKSTINRFPDRSTFLTTPTAVTFVHDCCLLPTPKVRSFVRNCVEALVENRLDLLSLGDISVLFVSLGNVFGQSGTYPKYRFEVEDDLVYPLITRATKLATKNGITPRDFATICYSLSQLGFHFTDAQTFLSCIHTLQKGDKVENNPSMRQEALPYTTPNTRSNSGSLKGKNSPATLAHPHPNYSPLSHRQLVAVANSLLALQCDNPAVVRTVLRYAFPFRRGMQNMLIETNGAIYQLMELSGISFDDPAYTRLVV